MIKISGVTDQRHSANFSPIALKLKEPGVNILESIFYSGHVHLGQGGPDHPSRKRGGQEEAGGDEDGGADEGGEEGTVDGLSPGTWLGKERPMPWIIKENNIEYFPKHTHYLYLSKNPRNNSTYIIS